MIKPWIIRLIIFVDMFRFEASRNAEKAYDHLLLKDAVQLFYLSDKSQLDEFIKQEAENGRVRKIV